MPNIGELAAKLTFETKEAQANLERLAKSLGISTAELKKLITAEQRTKGAMDKTTASTRKQTETAVRLAATWGAAVLAYAAVTRSLGSLVRASNEQELALADVAATLISTEHAAGITEEAARDLARELQNLTTFSDETILRGEALLLTFTNIGQNIFPQATETMLNMAQKMGTDLKQSAIQLGKALQDPIRGAAALRDVGVNVTLAQTAQIRSLVELGQMEEAQMIILDELQIEFGGLARAMAETSAGSMLQMQNRFTSLQEAMGDIVKKGMGPFMKPMGDVADALSRTSTAMQSAILVAGLFGSALLVLRLKLTLAKGAVGALLTILAALVGLMGQDWGLPEGAGEKLEVFAEAVEKLAGADAENKLTALQLKMGRMRDALDRFLEVGPPGQEAMAKFLDSFGFKWTGIFKDGIATISKELKLMEEKAIILRRRIRHAPVPESPLGTPEEVPEPEKVVPLTEKEKAAIEARKNALLEVQRILERSRAQALTITEADETDKLIRLFIKEKDAIEQLALTRVEKETALFNLKMNFQDMIASKMYADITAEVDAKVEGALEGGRTTQDVNQQNMDELLQGAQTVSGLLQRGFQGAGDDFLKVMLTVLQTVTQVAHQAQLIKLGQSAGPFGIIGALFGGLLSMGGFQKGGYTGSKPGLVHPREIVFEERIAEPNKAMLMQLRKMLQGGKRLQGLSSAKVAAGAATEFDPALLAEIRKLRGDVKLLEIQQPIVFKQLLDAQRMVREELPEAQTFEDRKKV